MKNKNTKQKASQESFPFAGIITIAEGGYGFVKFNGVTVFVPANLLAAKEIVDKSVVRGEFVDAFDKKRNQDGYRAVSLEKVEE